MSLKMLQIFQVVVGACVAGIVICLAGTIVTAVHRHHVAAQPVNPATIPVPATATGR